MTHPAWLPKIFDVNGDWTAKVNELYAIFRNDFIINRPTFNNLPIKWDDRRLDGDSFEEGFWHLVTRQDHSNGSRLPDFRRAERLPWCMAVLKNHNDAAVTLFCHDHGKKNRHGEDIIRTYLWLRELYYVVILEERKRQRHFFLHTAFHVDKRWEYTLKEKFEKRIARS